MGLLDIFKSDKVKSSQAHVIKPVDEPIGGYTLKYSYKDVVAVQIGEFPNWAELGNKVVFVHVTDDKFNPNSIRLLLVPQKKWFGYMGENKIKDMIIDYLERGDKVEARISSFEKVKYDIIVKLNIAFFKKTK